MDPSARILELLHECGPLPAKQIVRRLVEREKRTLEATLAEMIRDGEVAIDRKMRLAEPNPSIAH